MKLNYAHLCEHAFISEYGTPSFMGVFNRTRASSLPAFRQNTAIVINLDPEDTNQHTVRIELKSPSGQLIEKRENKIGPVDEKNQNLGYITNLKNLQFKEGGFYNFEIFIDNKELSKLPFSLEVIK